MRHRKLMRARGARNPESHKTREVLSKYTQAVHQLPGEKWYTGQSFSVRLSERCAENFSDVSHVCWGRACW